MVATLVAATVHAQQPTGAVELRVVDQMTQAPLARVRVDLAEGLSATTGSDGTARIAAVPVGSYTVLFTLSGYEPRAEADVVVKSSRAVSVAAEMMPEAPSSTVRRGEAITVRPAYFPGADEQAGSLATLSYESIRRNAGSAGDVSRIVAGLPSVAKVGDSGNTLVVRGGSPTENGFFLDNIEIPNINHFPSQGSSAGPIGLLNVDFIQDVRFLTGGFPATYGDRLSSVMRIDLREGNRETFGGQVDLNFAGFGFVAEGPLPGRKGSFLVSGRRSVLDLLVDAIGTGVAPRYDDGQAKLIYDLGGSDRLPLLGVVGRDEMTSTRDNAIKDDDLAYGTFASTEFTTGLNWQHLWGASGFSDTSVAFSSTRYRARNIETRTDDELAVNRSLETSFTARSTHRLRLSASSQIDFGVEARRQQARYDNVMHAYTDAFGRPLPALSVDQRDHAWKAAGHLSHTWTPGRFGLTLGARGDYSDYAKRATVSPRAELSFRLTQRTTLTAAGGIFHQTLPLILLQQQPADRLLRDPLAYHAVVGLSHLIGEKTRLSIEAYDKEYRNFPLDPDQPQLFTLDEPFYRFGFFMNHQRLVDTGRARARGIEATLERRASRGVYGAISGALFETTYRGYDALWRPRMFDNRVVLGAEGGYKSGGSWEFGVRWNYGGGTPYTPFDERASTELHRGVFDETRVNGARLPAYHSLNLRVDKRFSFHGSNLVAYLSVWNAYGRENIAGYRWNEIKDKLESSKQWGTLPIFGLEFEF